jgi:hypothetical protein
VGGVTVSGGEKYEEPLFARAIRRKARPRKQRKSKVGALKRELWRLFAAAVKARDGAVCISCGTVGMEGANWHAGHFIRKDGHAAIEFDPKNVHSQCGRCNLHERGNAGAQALQILGRYGEAELRRLIERSRVLHRWQAWELRDLIDALEKGMADYELLYYERYL